MFEAIRAIVLGDSLYSLHGLRRNCLVQVGGSDQWGNIVDGVELVRRMRPAAVSTRPCGPLNALSSARVE